MYQPKKKTTQEVVDSYDYLAHTASTTECTGLMPTPATSEAERESYEDIFPYKPPQSKK